jgi:hypothetical protein
VEAKKSAKAFGVFHLRDTGLYNWQWLFIIEGVLTVSMAVIAWFWLPTGPESAWFLNGQERLFAVARILRDHDDYTPHDYNSNDVKQAQITQRDVLEAAKDWKTWYVLVFNICASVPNQTFSVFLPLVVEGLGYSSIEANLVSTTRLIQPLALLIKPWIDVRTTLRVWCSRPVPICAQLRLQVGLRVHNMQRSSLRRSLSKDRGHHIVGGICITIIGLIITIAYDASRTRYAGLCILLFGSYISAPLTMAWLSGNTPGELNML